MAKKCCLSLYFLPGKILITSLVNTQLSITITKEVCETTNLPQNLYHLYHSQSSCKIRRTNGIFKLNLDKLLEILSKKYQDARVSFQLPSLKVNSFTLPLLEKLSEVRKSGLTFAVETPSDAWQLSLNKEVFKEKLFTFTPSFMLQRRDYCPQHSLKLF